MCDSLNVISHTSMTLCLWKEGGLEDASGEREKFFEFTPSIMSANAPLASRTKIVFIIYLVFF